MKRRGKAVKKKRGDAATSQPGSAAPPREFDASAVADRLHLWWQNGDGQAFIIGHQSECVAASDADDGISREQPGVWGVYPERKIVNILRKNWVRQKVRVGEILSEVDELLLYVMEHRRLSETLEAIPGYRAGIYHLQGKRVLVKSSPQLLDFKAGEWPTVQALIEGKLDLVDDEGHGVRQTDYFHAWMKKALESLYLGGPGNFQSGPCLVFAGPADVGKSRIQHQIITPLLGNRSADPSAYLFGKTDFNSEIFSAEHVMMEELEQTSAKTVDRTLFGERVKKLVSSDRQRLHAKRVDARMVEPFFRMTISINNDPDKLRLLFLLTPDIRDKVMLFLVSDAPLPMPAVTLVERQSFRETIAAELPAYGHWLMNEFRIPVDLEKGRFGVKCWHHPTLAMELFDDTPAAELLQIIDAADFSSAGQGVRLWDLKSKAPFDENVWEGPAVVLERLLLGEIEVSKCSLERQAKKLLQHHKLERLLSRLKEDAPDRVSQHRTKMARGWRISAPEK